MDRREFLRLLAIAGIASSPAACAIRGRSPETDIYAAGPFGEARLMHFTDCHAQLLPVCFREPSVNLGFGEAKNQPPHLVGVGPHGVVSWGGLPGLDLPVKIRP